MAEVPVRALPLAGGPEVAEREISALAWYRDRLVLLPQYPELFPLEGGALFAIPRTRIEAFLDGGGGPIEADSIPFSAPGLAELFPGFDGFEAIAFAGERVFVTIETRRDSEATVGWLLAGEVVGEGEAVVIDPAQHVRLPAQNDLPNTGYEAMVIHDDRVLVLYETNGEVNPNPRALSFDHSLVPRGELALDRIEYRVTDATEAEADGTFWVSNYHWPGAPWQPGACALTERYGQGKSHRRCSTVERLVQLQIADGRIRPTPRPPILLELVDDDHARNWEGLVRLPGRGFLLMTDEHPTSILGFVPTDDP